MTNPQDQRPSKNFAPFSSANSGELRLAAGYFLVSGISTIVILSVALIGDLFAEPGLGAVVTEHPLQFFLGLGMQFLASAGWIWTAFLLSSRRRLGGILAVAFLLLPLVSIPWFPIHTSTIVFSVVGLAVVASVWNELS